MPSTEPLVLHADGALLVIDKPAGLLAVPGRGADKQDCLSTRIQARYGDARIVHRLDMATSGLMLMARGTVAQQHLNRAFAERRVQKRYEAIVHGAVDPTGDGWREIDLPIAVDWPNRPLRVINHETGKASVTRLQRLQFDAARNTSHVLLEPLTGRTHQLRLHLQAIGHPILGDALYAQPAVVAMAPRLLLHACVLGFTHPISGIAMEFHRPMPVSA